jgi:ADP-heptose:LPS heptosyltransferase
MASTQYTRKLGDTLHIYAVWKKASHLPITICDRYTFLFPDAPVGVHTQWSPHKQFKGVRHNVHAREALAETFDVDVSQIGAPLWERPSHKGYIALCPNASRPDKEWSRLGWTHLINELNRRGLPYRWLTGMVSKESMKLPDLITVLSQARAVIGVDSGPLHVADAFGIPAVGLYGPTSPVCYGPYGSRHLAVNHHRYPDDTGIWCKDGKAIMESITTEEVLAKLDEALKL